MCSRADSYSTEQNDPTQLVPDAFLSILRTPDAARAAIDASPIRYRLIPNSPAPQQSSLAPIKSIVDSSDAPTPSNEQEEDESIFEIRISPSHYRHDLAISTSPLYRSYKPVDPSHSSIAADLSSRIPHSISSAAFCDWVTDAQGQMAGFTVDVEGDDGQVGNGNGARDTKTKFKTNWSRVGTESTMPWRIRDRLKETRENEIPAVMKGLMKVWNQRQSSSR
jgi:hypothetical protein